MPDDPQFSRKQLPFDHVGVDLNAPVDRTRDGLAVVLENLRPEQDGSLSVRPGQGDGTTIIGGQSPIHSLRRMNDYSSGSLVSAIIVGAGTHCGLCAPDFTGIVDFDSGYSGDPLSIAIHQPRESVKPYAYIADRARMRKTDVAGVDKQIGLPPPTTPPVVSLDRPYYKPIQETFGAGAWANTGTAGAVATTTRVDPATITITAILYDTGTTGWACVRPSSMNNIGALMRLRVGAGGTQEIVTVEQVTRGSTISAITTIGYEPGTGPGLCWIHLATPAEEIEVGSLIVIGVEYIRVLAVERTPNGQTSFRCNTVGVYTPLDSVQAFGAFRAYFANTHAAAEALGAQGETFQVTVGTGRAALTTALDLSAIATGLPAQRDDKVHCSVWLDKPELVSEIKLYMDIDAAVNTFTQNYLLHIIRQNDLTPVTKGTQTSIANDQIRYQRRLLLGDTMPGGVRGDDTTLGDNYSPDNITPPGDISPLPAPDRADQSEPAQNQWAEIIFTVGELLTPDIGRIGSDMSRGLRNVAAIQVEVVATGTVNIKFDSWWVGGGYGPDVSAAGRPMIARYRGRDSSTGAVSNWSPASRGGILPRRQRAIFVATQHSAAECDKIDFEVYGGDLLGWIYAGWSNNGATPTLLFDLSATELVVRGALSEGNVHYQPWPVISTPISGTCTVSGTLVTLNTGSMNVLTAPGTAIRIGSRDYTLYRCFSSTRIELVESAGVGNTLTWECAAPLIQGQPLPIWSSRPFHGFFFALGDTLNPWRLYYTNGDDPDSTRYDHWIDIEAEVLQNVLVTTDGRCFVWSTEREFVIEPAFTTAEAGGALFAWRPVGKVGLPFRYALCDEAFLGKDGIYAFGGGDARLLTEDLRTIFPHEGSAGVSTNGFDPPDLRTAFANDARLSYVHGELIFDYLSKTGNMNGDRRTIVRRTGADGRAGWRPYVYSVGAQLHYAEEGKEITTVLLGGVDGKLYRLGRTSADAGGATIVGTIQPRSEDGGDAIISKYLGDLVIDYDTDGGVITVTPGYDNNSSVLDGPYTLNEAAGRRQRRLDIGTPSGSGRRAKNVTLRAVMSVTTKRPKLYLWQLAWEMRPETTLLRAHDYNLVGGTGVKFARGLYIYADTYSANRTAQFEYTKDDGTVATLTITNINHAALTERYYPIPAGIYLIGSRMRPTDGGTWDFVGYRLDGEAAPPLSTEPDEWTDFGEARFVQGVRYHIDTNNAPVNMLIRVDENAVQTTIQAGANSGPVLANGRAIKVYSFDVPFITHLIRSEPSAARRLWKAEYISEPEPELAYMWWAQQTDCGMEGFKFCGDGQLTVRSTGNIVLEFDLDGAGAFAKQAVFYDASTNSAGARRAYRFRCPVMKFKTIQPRIRAASTSGRVSIYKKEFAIQVRGWGNYHVSINGTPVGEDWQAQNWLGDLHFDSGARV